ncbi:hypothetical protein GGR50DRAFT_703148 [Xylaria sp. CBS 124048]|nr:hypothetical protein GGR50DRAFT_703148 [Xylaria sp. CBS 124048]
MAQDTLSIGRCHLETGYQRYHLPSDVRIPWESSDADPAVVDAPNMNEVFIAEAAVDPDDDDDDDDIFAFDATATMDELPEEFSPEMPSETRESTTIKDNAPRALGLPYAPGIALYRLNLTVLSQQYNMYVAGYREKIHISRVRSCLTNSLPPRPDLIVQPPETPESSNVGGYLDTRFPHQINHMIIGNLGEAEVLLLSFDDGDVVAYYTSHFEAALFAIEHGEARRDTINVKPFFLQNVGKSAWGLAIHQKSRLMAIGTNLREVHVFAFALSDPLHTCSQDEYEPVQAPYVDEEFLVIRKDVLGEIKTIASALGTDINDSQANLHDIKPLSHRRERGYRIILETGCQGNNIPNVAFSEDPYGDAVGVVAIDITGNMWVLDLWSTGGHRQWFVESLHNAHRKTLAEPDLQRMRPHPERRVPRGWGVLVLPASSFLPTKTFQDSLGLSPKEAEYVKHNFGRYIGTTKAVDHIPDNSMVHPWVRSLQSHRFDDAFEWDLDAKLTCEWYDPEQHCGKKDWCASRDLLADESSQPPFVYESKKTNAGSLLADGSSIMRTYETDIELMGGDEHNIGIMCRNVIYQEKPPRARVPRMSFDAERLSNLFHVPELSLVIAGSLCGRVALISLTRPANPQYSFKRGFKVEAILPTKTDEDKHLRPICPLLGVAVGPIPVSGSEEDTQAHLGERRYRIMLHYYDHRILSYELYRTLTTQELSII